MQDYDEFEIYLNNNFKVGITKKSDVESFFDTKGQEFATFEYISSRNLQIKHLINSTQDYDSVIQFSARVRHKYWLIFSTVFIKVVRLHFNNDDLVEIVTLTVEDGSL